jgi:hypothetical protein
MGLRDFLRTRRERKARERAEHGKALRERKRESSPDNVADALKERGSSYRAWGESSSSLDPPERKKRSFATPRGLCRCAVSLESVAEQFSHRP